MDNVERQKTESQRLEEVADWHKRNDADKRDPRELFEQVSHISVCMAYDLIDKLRWYEKETVKLKPGEIEKRLPHMTAFLEQLRTAYLQFSDVDL